MTTRTVDLANTQGTSPPQELSHSSSKSVGVQLISTNQLCGDIGERWKAIRAKRTQFATPYFDMEFTKAVSRVRDDVEVAIIKDDELEGEIVGFLPFQRISDYHAEPVGGRLNDVHGLMSGHSNRNFLMTKILHAAKLRSFGFHAGVKYEKQSNPYEFEEIASHYIDLSQGWEPYRKWVRGNSKAVKRQGQKTRALEREHGTLRFDFDCSSSEVLERLIELKRAKYQRSKTFDILSVEWAANLLREISTTDRPGFKGLLSVLWAGNNLVAVHFGMQTERSIHYWFPTFDVQYSKYSPGTELILRVAEQAALLGISKVDFGYGDDAYKFRFCNGQEQLSCGQFTGSRIGYKIAKQRYVIRKQLKNIPLKPLAKRVLRSVFPSFGSWNFK